MASGQGVAEHYCPQIYNLPPKPRIGPFPKSACQNIYVTQKTRPKSIPFYPNKQLFKSRQNYVAITGWGNFLPQAFLGEMGKQVYTRHVSTNEQSADKAESTIYQSNQPPYPDTCNPGTTGYFKTAPTVSYEYQYSTRVLSRIALRLLEIIKPYLCTRVQSLVEQNRMANARVAELLF